MLPRPEWHSRALPSPTKTSQYILNIRQWTAGGCLFGSSPISSLVNDSLDLAQPPSSRSTTPNGPEQGSSGPSPHENDPNPPQKSINGQADAIPIRVSRSPPASYILLPPLQLKASPPHPPPPSSRSTTPNTSASSPESYTTSHSTPPTSPPTPPP